MAVSAAALGGAASMGGGLATAALSYGLNAMSTSKAHDRQKNMMTRGPTYVMEGLRKAGINPILAAGSSGFGGTTAKAPQAGSATVSGTNLPQAALMGKQMALTDASTAKTIAEAGIVSAGQPAADWNAEFNKTETGKTILQMERVNAAMPNTWSGMTGKGLFNLWQHGQENKGPKPPWRGEIERPFWDQPKRPHNEFLWGPKGKR